MAATTTGGVSALHLAAYQGDASTVNTLLAHCTSEMLNAATVNHHTPLHIAVHSGSVDCMHLIAAAKADLNAVGNGGSTALHYAASRGAKRMVTGLLGRKADLSLADSRGRRVVHIAAYHGHVEVLQALLAAFAGAAEALGQTPGGYVTRELDREDRQGYTALLCACEAGHASMAGQLLRQRVAKGATTKGGRNGFHLAAASGKLNAEMCRVLHQAGVRIDTRDGAQQAPLHIAASTGDIAVTEVLLAVGADPRVRDGQRRTTHHLAAAKNFTDWVLQFSAGGPSAMQLEGQIREVTVLKETNYQRQKAKKFLNAKLKEAGDKIVAKLDKLRAQLKAQWKAYQDIDQQDTTGSRPVHYAVKSGEARALQVLIGRQADPSLPDKDNRPPLYYAAESGNLAAVEVLLPYGTPQPLP